MGEHAAAAADARIIEQQVDPVGLLLLLHLVAEALHLGGIRDVGEMRGKAQPLRQALQFAEPLRFLHRVG